MNRTSAFLGLDLGTGSVKALVLDASGRTLGQGTAQCPPHNPAPGWSEADPRTWWAALCRATRAAIAETAESPVAIGLSGQMHGAIGLDAAGEPVRPPILWPDTRSATQLERYRRLPAEALDRLANPPAVGMMGPTLCWLDDHEPWTLERAVAWVQPKDWARRELTGRLSAEHSDASATLLYDVPSQTWATDVVAALGLDAIPMCDLVESIAIAGRLTPQAADSLGLPPGVPVAGGGADVACAFFGNGAPPPGMAQLTVGSGATITVPAQEPIPDRSRRTHLFRSVEVGRFYAMAAMQNVGLALDWVRRTTGSSWDDLYGSLAASPPGARGVTFLPYLSAERTPHMDPQATGAWTGLRGHHTREDLLRAAVEGSAFTIRDGLDALLDTGVAINELRLAGGGSVGPSWRQLIADVLDRPILATPVTDASAYGAARLAARAMDTELPAAAEAGVQVVAEPGAERGAYDEPLARFRRGYQDLHEGTGVTSPLG